MTKRALWVLSVASVGCLALPAWSQTAAPKTMATAGSVNSAIAILQAAPPATGPGEGKALGGIAITPADEENPKYAPDRLRISVVPIGDLTESAQDYPLKSALTPLNVLHQGMDAPRSGGGLFGGYGDSTRLERNPEVVAQELVQLVETLVEPDAWQSNGGSCSIRVFQNNMIFSAPLETTQKAIELFNQLRQQRKSTEAVRIELRFISLDEAPPASATVAGSFPAVVTDDFLNAHAASTATLSASGFARQTLHVASGSGRQSITAVQPVVGTGASAYQPEMTLILSGVAAEFSVGLNEDGTAQLEIKGSYAGPLTADPASAGASDKAKGEPGRQPMPETVQGTAYQFASTVQLEMGKPVLIAQGSLEPTGTKPARQVAVVVKVIGKKR